MNKDLKVFPTGKSHVSYSEVRGWKECSYRHKLQHIDKIDLGKPSPYLDFGTAVHEGCENYLNSKTIPREKLLNDIRVAWEKYGFEDPEWIKQQPGWYKYEHVSTWCTWAENMWNDIPDFLDKTFPGWETVSAEEMLYEPIEEKNLSFKGFIDVVIKVPRKNGTYKYWILDWKTAKSYGWDRRKKQDILTQAQIVLYKHYWATKNNIPLKDVGTGFILLKRGGKPGNICEFFQISVGPKAIEKARKMVRNMVSSVRSGMYFKNRDSCRFCEYYQTEHCT
tara:strand:+ start:426 stop:1262 length:837 start_codon:yes stop_codon:yes gene_type:complete